MHVRDQIKNNHNLKRFSYKILRKHHKLCRNKPLNVILSKRTQTGDFYYSELAINYYQFFFEISSDLKEAYPHDANLLHKADQFLMRLKSWKDIIHPEIAYRANAYFKHIPSVGKLLNSHTNLFNCIKSSRCETKPDLRKWTDIVLNFVAIWEDEI